MTKISLPNQWTVKRLKSEPSILWSGSTLYEDFQVISILVDKIVAGDAKHKSKCAEKIFNNIQNTSWQKQYPVRSFIFLIFYSFTIAPIDIKTMLHCQAFEIFYYFKINPKKEQLFKARIIELYNNVYGLDFKNDTANIIRITRNNVAHAGTIEGIQSQYKSQDKKTVQAFLKANNLKELSPIAASFNWLIDDIVIRILGLDDSDLSRNAQQPYNNIHFKRSHIVTKNSPKN